MKKQQKQKQYSPKPRRNPVYPYQLCEISTDTLQLRIKDGRFGVRNTVNFNACIMQVVSMDVGRAAVPTECTNHRAEQQDLLSVLNFSYKEVQRELQRRGVS